MNTVQWVKVDEDKDYGNCYRIEPGVIITSYLCAGDTNPSFVASDAMPGPWFSLGQLKAAHNSAGKFYFSTGAVSFFKARFNEVLGGRLLIDSVRSMWEGGRQYRVSVWSDDAITNSRLGEFDTLAAARRFACEIIKAAE